MFQWYRDAEVCYAWLADLAPEDTSTTESFLRCRWFTRGWTLQELIAPRRVEFYDKPWGIRGTKSDLKDILISVTGINGDALENPDTLYRIPVAQRMSWAATRQTTRVEDMAYCLLGIFDINMPMLYGEGPRAFLRLQEHIVKEVNDLSIFAWKTHKEQTYHGVFAEDVAAFGDSSSIQAAEDMSFGSDFTVTNKGVQIEAIIAASVEGGYLVKLNCTEQTEDGLRKRIGIYLGQHPGGIYSRTRAFEYAPDDEESQFQSRRIFIFKHVSPQRSIDLQQSHQNAFFFRSNFNSADDISFPDFPFHTKTIKPGEHWDARRRMFLTHGASDFTAYIMFDRRETLTVGQNIFPGQWFILVLGVTAGEDRPWITVAGMSDGGPDLYVAGDNLRALAAKARKRRFELSTTVDGMMVDNDGIPMDLAPVGRVSATIDQDTVDGQSVYCIDLHYEAISASQKGASHRFVEHSFESEKSDSDHFAGDMDSWNSS
jgi:hypothetical protein